MQIVIPMSGYGERFRRAGYSVPKPLIEVEGKPIVAHIVDLFPGEKEFIFICNREHLQNPSYHMAEILRDLAPNGRIVPIGPHKLGPVNTVLEAQSSIDRDRPVIVNYCDFTCYWNYADFKRFVVDSKSDGCIPAYRGLHPHSLGSTMYAYMRQEDLWLSDIQEKKPFTGTPMNEFASSGTYYFRNGGLCLDSFQEQIAQGLAVNDEFYVSLAYKILRQWNKSISVYELQHFMQWGTPQDLREYNNWSSTFRRLASDDSRRGRHAGAVLLPMAGLGARFAEAGYELPKPLIPVSGRPMVIQAVRDLPSAPVMKFVLRRDLPGAEAMERKLRATFVGAEFMVLEALTAGQAISCLHGTENLNVDEPVTIGACDNGILYSVDALAEALAEGEDKPDLLVWTVRGHPDGQRRPEMYGWVETDPSGRITAVSVKSPMADPANDPMIIGTFTFRRLSDFKRAVDALVARNGRINNEFYVDSVIEDCLAAGLSVRLFEVDSYIGWGTPVDLQVFEYWQSCFHKWPSHPYRLEKDSRIPASAISQLSDRYAARRPPRPIANGQSADETKPERTDETTSILRRFFGGMNTVLRNEL